ncbi:hypothetical protein [Chloroflexus sp.]|nr:hypothetical protein [Chloroflexus sp.]
MPNAGKSAGWTNKVALLPLPLELIGIKRSGYSQIMSNLAA